MNISIIFFRLEQAQDICYELYRISTLKPFSTFSVLIITLHWCLTECNTTNFRTGIASFAPKEKGTYAIMVFTSNEKHIKGSPFSIPVGDAEMAHANKVQITGAISSAAANSQNFFVIDTTGAGENFHKPFAYRLR